LGFQSITNVWTDSSGVRCPAAAVILDFIQALQELSSVASNVHALLNRARKPQDIDFFLSFHAPSVAFVPGKCSTNCCQEFGCAFFNPTPFILPSRQSFTTATNQLAPQLSLGAAAAVLPGCVSSIATVFQIQYIL
jgi:hypothetical protein